MEPGKDRSDAVGEAEVEVLAPGVWRLTAPNPSPMTYTGTQTYIIGAVDVPVKARDARYVVIDPGPDDPAHFAAILRCLGSPTSSLAAILVTHSHLDHSAGVARLKAATGAPVLAFGPHGTGMSGTMRALAVASPDLGGGEGADRAFAPDEALIDGAQLDLGIGAEIRAIHTPGHLSNHLSFSLADRGLIFTGDAVMGWSTTLVSPPEGDMAQQMATLQRLGALVGTLDAPRLMPGHGPVVEDPVRLIAEHRAHRDARRAALIAALEDGPANARALAGRLYTDTPPALMAAAARNVLATLLQLHGEGSAEPTGRLSADVAFRLI
ncbi:MAG: MBL fold metallo-hydrolase [Pseudomonadota bacterium]